MTHARTHQTGGTCVPRVRGHTHHIPCPWGGDHRPWKKGVWGALGPKKGSDGRSTVWWGDMHTRVEEGAAFQKARPPD